MNPKASNYSKPLLLSLETAGTSCSVCLSEGTHVLFEMEEHEAYRHNELLADFTDRILKLAKLMVKDLDAIVINHGPGSYTGLRVGFAFGKALSYASGIPLYPVSGLEGMATEAIEFSTADWYIPMLDARRMEVYSAVYDSSLNCIDPPLPVILSKEFFEQKRFDDQKILLIGEAAEKAMRLDPPSNYEFLPIGLKASNLITPALKRMKLPADDSAYMEPMYLKEVRITTSKKTLK
ncbi:MAG: tRNA (adenosine(37)-N6)-threonylcarbamoyltransferase complex dimerization subunit type 1 TsaB [Saprospirales bacterium]|nr:MAG: tRNA (adenosine(37)-N6)-threonylcarbamoyltransferase complex dimerization subunit type 1 TsaB [Saprospirales bacterium]